MSRRGLGDVIDAENRNRPTGEFLATRIPLCKTALRVVSRWHAVSGRWIAMRAPLLHITATSRREQMACRFRPLNHNASAVLPIGEYLLLARARG
jgi:hypothetical protein